MPILAHFSTLKAVFLAFCRGVINTINPITGNTLLKSFIKLNETFSLIPIFLFGSDKNLFIIAVKYLNIET